MELVEYHPYNFLENDSEKRFTMTDFLSSYLSVDALTDTGSSKPSQPRISIITSQARPPSLALLPSEPRNANGPMSPLLLSSPALLSPEIRALGDMDLALQMATSPDIEEFDRILKEMGFRSVMNNTNLPVDIPPRYCSPTPSNRSQSLPRTQTAPTPTPQAYRPLPYVPKRKRSLEYSYMMTKEMKKEEEWPGAGSNSSTNRNSKLVVNIKEALSSLKKDVVKKLSPVVDDSYDYPYSFDDYEGNKENDDGEVEQIDNQQENEKPLPKAPAAADVDTSNNSKNRSLQKKKLKERMEGVLMRLVQ